MAIEIVSKGSDTYPKHELENNASKLLIVILEDAIDSSSLDPWDIGLAENIRNKLIADYPPNKN